MAYLAAERIGLDRARRRLRLGIALTGIRGKSSVTRLVAAGLRQAGFRVLAKTTGSRPVIITPDGRETEIKRAGQPSIREQVKLLALASRLKAEVLVVETMSIRPDNLSVELRRIIQPDILALTNVRPDHRYELGRNEQQIARSLAAAVPNNSILVIPEREIRPEFEQSALDRSTELRSAQEAHGQELDGAGIPGARFKDNFELALAVLALAGIDRNTSLAGMRKAGPDFGALKAWRIPVLDGGRTALCFSAFAANDPRSSAEIVDMIKSSAVSAGRPLIGLLCLRDDRGDRTLQWLEAAREGFFDSFERVAVFGRPANAFRLKLAGGDKKLKEKFFFKMKPEPDAVVDELCPAGPPEPVFIGLGNIVGLGEAFIENWEKRGVPHGI